MCQCVRDQLRRHDILSTNSPSKVLNSRAQALSKLLRRLPTKVPLGYPYGGLPLPWIVLRKGAELYSGARASHLDDHEGQILHGELSWIAEINRPRELVAARHKREEARNHIVYKAKAPGLQAVAI